jgi:hypothetical protein
VADSSSENTSETDKNIATMFDILRKHKRARLEALILNRRSFSQTVENIFALSFLVKDGRVEINFDKNKNHIVGDFRIPFPLCSFQFYLLCPSNQLNCFVFVSSVPKNAPTANGMASGEGSYSQFIFRFDYGDWKASDYLRWYSFFLAVCLFFYQFSNFSAFWLQLMMESIESGQELMPHRTVLPLYPNAENASATQIRKISRNRGREAPPAGGAQEASESNSGSSEKDDFSQRPVVKKSKRLL